MMLKLDQMLTLRMKTSGHYLTNPLGASNPFSKLHHFAENDRVLLSRKKVDQSGMQGKKRSRSNAAPLNATSACGQLIGRFHSTGKDTSKENAFSS